MDPFKDCFLKFPAGFPCGLSQHSFGIHLVILSMIPSGIPPGVSSIVFSWIYPGIHQVILPDFLPAFLQELFPGFLHWILSRCFDWLFPGFLQGSCQEFQKCLPAFLGIYPGISLGFLLRLAVIFFRHFPFFFFEETYRFIFLRTSSEVSYEIPSLISHGMP